MSETSALPPSPLAASRSSKTAPSTVPASSTSLVTDELLASLRERFARLDPTPDGGSDKRH
jgi:hypothetical protein